MKVPSTEPPTLENFIEWGLTRDTKYEFAGGTVSALPGGTLRHMDLVMDLAMRRTRVDRSRDRSR